MVPFSALILIGLLCALLCVYTLIEQGEIFIPYAFTMFGALNALLCLGLYHRRRSILDEQKALRMKQIGILGSGQLGRMLAQAGVSLGVPCKFLDDLRSKDRRNRRAPATTTGEVDGRGFDDPDVLTHFAEGLSVLSYEFENVPLHAAKLLEQRVPVRPSPRSLEVAQDRLNERELFERVGIASPKHAAVETLAELETALAAGFPLPAIIKTRRLGYDGKGQARLRELGDAAEAWATIAAHGVNEASADVRVPAILDEMIPFVRELSVVAVRGQDGEVRCYPPFENVHESGILRKSVCPAPGVSGERIAELESAARKIGEDLGHIGVFAVEFFETAPDRDGSTSLLANEIAPRVHNTGHGTIEGHHTSQFENHLRAILGLPLGSTAARGHSAMLNIIGDWPDRDALLRIPGLSLHNYEKSAKPGRKIGHVTLVAASAEELAAKTAEAEAVIAGSTVLA